MHERMMRRTWAIAWWLGLWMALRGDDPWFVWFCAIQAAAWTLQWYWEPTRPAGA